ncbi:hypothetical protein [Asticcacaulis sp. AND118]|jgi:hypothetical protein|uniref:hypothetical protein n=1 Tax=Asticcacaulis sp. AND118 TaxID=2840468 RepID=UPI001CFFC7CD|nr:hypothetical protein [Asticcacaulis sp. AND118]UDF05776.1 hypothetical protein LH365_18345 [Asticcacaulis sp. AND118]
MSGSKISSLDLSDFEEPTAVVPPAEKPVRLSREEERAILDSNPGFPSREPKAPSRKVNMNLYVSPGFSELVKATSKQHRYSYGELFEMSLKHLLETKGIK